MQSKGNLFTSSVPFCTAQQLARTRLEYIRTSHVENTRDPARFVNKHRISIFMKASNGISQSVQWKKKG